MHYCSKCGALQYLTVNKLKKLLKKLLEKLEPLDKFVTLLIEKP